MKPAPKHKIDWLSQQYRIRAGYAHRVAIEAWERRMAAMARHAQERAEMDNAAMGLFDLEAARSFENMARTGQKH